MALLGAFAGGAVGIALASAVTDDALGFRVVGFFCFLWSAPLGSGIALYFANPPRS
jgi:hypothetical protein